MAVNYFKKIGARRLLIMIMGNVFLGMGISIFKLSGLGNDPFSGMVMALANILGFSYASFLLVINGGLFIFELAAGRRLIGIGTLVNAFLLGYIVTFFMVYGPCCFLCRTPCSCAWSPCLSASLSPVSACPCTRPPMQGLRLMTVFP